MLPRLKLGKCGGVKKTVNQGGKSFVLRADRNLFARCMPDACSCWEDCVNCDNSQFSDDEDDASSEGEDDL